MFWLKKIKDQLESTTNITYLNLFLTYILFDREDRD